MIFTISCGQQGSFSTSHDSKVSYKLPDNPPSRIAAKPIDSKEEADDYSPPQPASQKTETVVGIVVSLGIAGLILWEVAKAHGEIHTAFKDYEAVRDEQQGIRDRIKKESDAHLSEQEIIRQVMKQEHEANMAKWSTRSQELREKLQKAREDGRTEDGDNLLQKLINLMKEIKKG